MEQTVSEIPPSQEQCISQHHGTVNGGGAHLEQDPVERGYPRRWTGPRRGAHNGSFGGDHRQEKVQVPICRDNWRGKCTRGAFCRYQHSDDHDGSMFFQNEQERLGTVATLGNSELNRVNGDSDSTTRFSSRGCRSRSPCRRFQSGRCYRGASCPYLHPEMSSFDKSIHDLGVEHQQVDRELRDPGFGMRNGDNFVRLSQERVEANKENNSRNMSFSGECRSTSPCQHFLRGKCDFGESCKRWHPVNTFVSSRHDLSVQPPQRIAATSSYPGSVPRSQDVTVWTSHEHGEVNMHNHLRTGALYREPRNRSPCRNFLSGKCYRGASCLHLHPVTVNDKTRFDSWSAQHHGVSGTSRSPHFVDGSIATSFRKSQNLDQPYQRARAFYEQDKAWPTNDGMQLAGNRENMDVTSRSWSYETQRSRMAGNFNNGKLRREVCLRFTKGRCDRGELCKYLHGYHEYATSTSNWSGKPDTEAARDSMNFGVANQYASTMTAQDHADVKNYQLSFGERKYTESSLNSSDGCSDREAKGRSVNDTIDPIIPDSKGDVTDINGLKCNVSGEKTSSFCNSAEGRENISLWSPPFKRQRRSRSPFTPQDDYHCHKFRRYDSRTDLRRGRSYNVAQFQYPDRRSYRYEKPMFRASIQQRTNGEVTLVNPCSRGNNDFKLVTPKGEEVFTQDLHLELHSKGSHGSNVVISGKKNEAESVGCDLLPSHSNQNDKDIATNSVTIDSSKGAAASCQDALESGSTCLINNNVVSLLDSDRLMLDKEADVEVPIDFGQEGKVKKVELMPSIKTYSRKRNRDVHLISCEETMKEEIDASKQETPLCSLAEGLLSDPNTMSVPSVPVDIEISTSNNRDLAKNVIMNDHGVKPKVKCRRRKKLSKSVSCDKAMNKEVSDESEQGVPVSSLVETSLSNPNTVTLSGAPADIEMSSSITNDLENPVIKKVRKRRKKKCSNSVSCEEPMKEEIIGASEQGMPNSSLIETSLSNPNIVSVSGLPVVMKMSSSDTNDLKTALIDDHPNIVSVSCEKTMKEEIMHASEQGMPNSSLIETSLSNLNIVSVSGLPVTKMSSSDNNDLKTALIDDHPNIVSVSCEDPMKEEIIDASEQGMPNSSLIETSLSNPNIISVSGLPVAMKMSSSDTNDLKTTLIDNNPVKQQIKKKKKRKKCSEPLYFEEPMKKENVPMDDHPIKEQAKKKRRKSLYCEEHVNKEETDNSKPGVSVTSSVETSLSNPNIVSVSGVPVDVKMSASNNNDLVNVHMPDIPVNQQALQLQSSLRGAVPNSRRKLLILDVNGLLVDIVAGPISRHKPDTMIATKAVFKRPFCYNFLQFCFERFDVGIWSSRTKKNLIKVVDFLMKNTKNRLLFCWDQSHCTATGYRTLENKEKPLVLKELRYLWRDNKWQSLPWDMGYYNETNTILLDDSPYKALRNPPYTAIFPHPYSYKNANDNSLGPGGDLRVYLERLAEAENVQKFILENPFGQRPISCSDKSWHFYSKIAGCYGRQQEEYANITPY